MKAELKNVSREKPLQLFWTKRLSPMNVRHEANSEVNSKISMPASLKTTGPGITDHMLLASISTHLHISKDPATGQATDTGTIETNPAAYINPGQPLMAKMSVSEEEILAQELKVKEARKKLAMAIKALR